jgi:hypothetical protein
MHINVVSNEKILAAAHRRNPSGIEPKPVHAAQVTRVFDFHASIHNNVETTVGRDPCTLFTDNVVLQP